MGERVAGVGYLYATSATALHRAWACDTKRPHIRRLRPSERARTQAIAILWGYVYNKSLDDR